MHTTTPAQSFRQVFRRTILQQMSLAFLLLFLGILVFVFTTERRSWLSRQEEASFRAASQVSVFLDRIEELLGFAVKIGQQDQQHQEIALQKLVEENEEILEVVWLSDQGNVIASEHTNQALLASVFTIPQSNWFLAASGGELYLSGLQLSANSTPYVIAAFPADNGEVVAARLDMRLMRSVVEEIKFGRTGKIFIANTMGEIIAYPDLEISNGQTILEDPKVLGIVSGQFQQDELIIYQAISGSWVEGVSEAIARDQWYVFTELSIFEAYSVTMAAIAISGLVIVIGFAASVTSAMHYMDKAIGQPLELLRLGAEQLAEENLDHRVPILHNDEFGLVARTFNKMAENLQQRNRELAIQAESLENEIAERRRYENQLRHDTLHDGLTALPNRVLLQNRLEHNIAHLHRNPDSSFAVVFLDLDRFKIVNDSLGHSAGDELLIVIARRLQHTVRTVDTVARLGGDEFVILLEDFGDPSEVEVIAHRILSSISEPIRVEGRDLVTSASIGIVFGHPAYTSPNEILRDADIAMYHAKALGKSRFEIFSNKLRKHALFRLNIEADLRRALENDELVLHYQPITALQSSKTTGYEALVRWDHPERGLISPGTFIPLAEESGLILPLGMWVLETACSQMAAWNEHFALDPLLEISVNLSGSQFLQIGLADEVGRILERTGLPGSLLNLEITEGTIIGDTGMASRVFAQLKALGVSIHMDDFGTGYSSLSYLRNFPMDAIKIDRIFVDKMDTENNNAGLVRTIIDMAQELGMEVVAEGIETDSQRALLDTLGCDYGQGYLIAKPQTVEDVEILLSQPQIA